MKQKRGLSWVESRLKLSPAPSRSPSPTIERRGNKTPRIIEPIELSSVEDVIDDEEVDQDTLLNFVRQSAKKGTEKLVRGTPILQVRLNRFHFFTNS